MITCANDSLTFDFPETNRQLNAFALGYVTSLLPKITQPDPVEIAKCVLKSAEWSSQPEKESAIKKAKEITRERVAEKFSALVSNGTATHYPRFTLTFQRTLRLPDDGKTYPLPPGLGPFPLRPIEDYSSSVPKEWLRQGGVLMPMFQAEALWLSFHTNYSFALKVGTGLVNALNARPWNTDLEREPQGYLVLPEQPWLDGYCSAPGVIRQFVATKLGRGYTAEEQLLGSQSGGIQLEAFPVKAECYFAKQLCDELPRTTEDVIKALIRPAVTFMNRLDVRLCEDSGAMGLGAGGKIKQEVYKDPWQPQDWNTGSPLRVRVHLCDAIRWCEFAGELPPQKPLTAKDYTDAGFPWFDYYRDDMDAIEGSPELSKLKSVFKAASEKGDISLPNADPVDTSHVCLLGPNAPALTITGWDGGKL